MYFMVLSLKILTAPQMPERPWSYAVALSVETLFRCVE
jgi:hypothetical protein